MVDRVTIIGAGNGGQAAAADLSHRGIEVTLYNRSPERLSVLERQGGIRLVRDGNSELVSVASITTDLSYAMSRSAYIVIMVPTSALESIGQLMAPYLKEHHRVLLAPGHTGGALAFRRTVEESGSTQLTAISEVNTLPYICRVTEPGSVTVWRSPKQLLMASLPSSSTESACSSFRHLFPTIKASGSILETSLSNYNAIMHTPGTILNIGWIEHTQGDFKFYSESITPGIGRIIDSLDSERLSIGRLCGLELKPFIDAFFDIGYTTLDGTEAGNAYRSIRASEPNKYITGPDSLNHRYMIEDVGYGLVPMSAIGRLVGAETPTIDALIHIASIAAEKDFTQLGFNLTKLGLEGKSKEEFIDMVAG